MSNNLHLFETFTKGKKTPVTSSRNCVIYTRVSTKEQADNNMSLATQCKACETYASKSGYHITGYFGGTYESAKTDERKEFNNMLSFVKGARKRLPTSSSIALTGLAVQEPMLCTLQSN